MRFSITTISFVFIFFFYTTNAFAQTDYWQQQANYEIAIDFNSKDHSFKGKQTLTYYNNSPDTLNKLFFHLYYNAFQPNSLMDVWQREIPDPQYGLDYKIKYLTSSETGWMKISQILQNTQQLKFNEKGTILEVILNQPLAPNSVGTFEMSFVAKVPLLCRRTGRDNDEGIDYTMGQWYPKVCVYDQEGWHATPFVGREFYSNFGDYEVWIHMDSTYTIAAGCDSYTTDLLDNSSKMRWHFISKNALDFSWAADPDYTNYSLETRDGIRLHFYYLDNEKYRENWEKMGEPLQKILPFINEQYRKYPYENYYIIQAGDGATEYSKSTFITGNRTLGSLVGVSIHEIMHSWFQHRIATQENRYAWLDEGFTSYSATQIKQQMREKGIFFGEPLEYLFQEQYDEYRLVSGARLEEPMNTPANYFSSNTAYYTASYSKGELFLEQMKYIVGEEAFDSGMKKYIDDWSFRHPKPDDFIKCMESSSDLSLDWFLHYWTNTTSTIDYRVQLDSLNDNQSLISLQRIGLIPMPMDIEVVFVDGTVAEFNIPLDLMNGHKRIAENKNTIVLSDWPWSHLVYRVELNIPFSKVKMVTIDPKLQMADINRNNNVFMN